MTPFGVPMEGNPRDRGSSMGLGGLEEVYRINEEEVTKEEWLQFQQDFEYHKNQENLEEEIIMNNEHRHEYHEEELGDNHNDNDDLSHEETFSTLQFPIQKPSGQDPMKNISPSVSPHFHGKSTEDPDEFLFEFDILC